MPVHQLRFRSATDDFRLTHDTGSEFLHVGGAHNLKRLLVRYDRHHQIHEAFVVIGCRLVCFRRLQIRSDPSS